MGKSYRETLNAQMSYPAFKEAWDAMEPEFQLIRLLLDAREKKHLTQKQLSELTGIAQADISRMENGTANPSIKTLQRLAVALGMQLKLEFVPNA